MMVPARRSSFGDSKMSQGPHRAQWKNAKPGSEVMSVTVWPPAAGICIRDCRGGRNTSIMTKSGPHNSYVGD